MADAKVDEVFAGTRSWATVRSDALAFLVSLPSASVDAIVTDPPYCSGGMTASDRQRPTSSKYQQTGAAKPNPEFAGDVKDQRSWESWCALWLSECYRVAKEGAPVCMFTDWRQLPSATDALQHGGFIWRGIVPWDKTTSVRPYKGRFSNQCEYVVWGSKGAMPMDRGVPWLPGVVRERVVVKEKRHIAGKPVGVMESLVRVCAPGGVVLDPFAGSASTGIACIAAGYRYLGCEVLDAYHVVGRERLIAEAAARECAALEANCQTGAR